MITELSRVLNTYGGHVRSYTMYLYMKVVSYLMRYLIYRAYTLTGDFKRELIEPRVNEIMDEMVGIYSISLTDEDGFVELP